MKTLEQRLADFHTLVTKTMGITYYELEFQHDKDEGNAMCIIRAKIVDKHLEPVMGDWVYDSKVPHAVALASARKKLIFRWAETMAADDSEAR